MTVTNMKKSILLLFAIPILLGCSSKDNEPETPSEISSIKFSDHSISIKYGESRNISVDKPIKDCKLYFKSDYCASKSIFGDSVNISASKVGNTYLYVEYKGVKDSCFISIKPKTFYFGDPIIELGKSRSNVISEMLGYQQGGTIGGYTGLNYQYNSDSKVYYQFDGSNNLVAVKQSLLKSSYSVSNILKSMNERFNYKSSSETVYWYSNESSVFVRIENTTFYIYIWFAKDALIMNEYFPW